LTKNKVPTVSIVFYVLAGLLILYSIWAAIFSYNYLSPIIAQGQLVVKGNEFEIASFYMSNIAQTLLFGIVFFALGWIIQMLAPETEVVYDFDDEEDMVVEVEAEELEEAETEVLE
jgi:hypothetical protein